MTLVINHNFTSFIFSTDYEIFVILIKPTPFHGVSSSLKLIFTDLSEIWLIVSHTLPGGPIFYIHQNRCNPSRFMIFFNFLQLIISFNSCSE